MLGADLPSPLVGSLRTVVAALALGPLLLRRSAGGPAAGPWSRSDRALLLAAGVCVAGYQVSFFVGVRSLGVAVGTIVAVGAAPFFAGMLASVARTERLTRARIATTLLAVVGLLLLVRPDGGVTPSAGGVLAALTAGLAFGAFTVLARSLLASGVRRIDTIAVPFLIGGALLLPVFVAGVTGLADPGALLRPTAILVVLWLGAAATAAGYLLFIAGLRDVTAVAATTLVLAEPLTATLLGVLALGERLGPVATIGALVVAAALVLTARRSGDTARRSGDTTTGTALVGDAG